VIKLTIFGSALQICSGDHFEKRGSFRSVFRQENSFNTLKEIFQDLMLSKSQQIFASAYKDIQRLIWNFHMENSTEKMLLRAKKKPQTHGLLTESFDVKKALILRKRTYSR